MSKVPSAKIVLLKDLSGCQVGESVRVTGIWTRYDADKSIAVIQYNDIEVEIDISQAQDQTILPEGDVVQCLGEIEKKTSDITRIHARIIRSVNTLDMELYERAVELRNKII
ncbi:telomere-capping, CST complex subunit-domain-containing protein [Gilbertella persicaria]|uniref:telomere-capping, CST complex subunit-domain-containing protein n=1 Tax=Gilbertella persicaria TaxID=101096 RepID=UPI0022203D1A|nr:telomere-capping, CST complex subunit-domain-containing protein [Gilbertella persicaria]KAI8048601.1 telomere-capping, CST complex subunit-domain-containing protein [Gilbertella persicaria]